jgi:hypothetical protein
VTTIGEGAFKGCTGLTSINIPNSMTSIGNSAFYECTSLKNIDIPDSVTIIDNFAFCGSGLEKVTIPSCLNIIGKHAFCNTLINEFVVKEDNKTYFATDGVLFERSIVSRLQNSILHAIKYFQGTNNDKSFHDSIDDDSKSSILLKYPPEKIQAKYVVNDDTTSLGCCAFKGAQYLEKIIMHNKLCSFGDEQTFALCISLKEIHIPPQVECIPSACFSGCKALESVYVCDRERLQIEKKAFERCISIKGLYFQINKPENITVAADAFDEETYNNCVLYIPSGTRWAYRHHPILGKFSNIEIEK